MKQHGFTIVEILVMTVIIGIIAVSTSVVYTSAIKSSRDAKRKTDLEQLRIVLESYRSKNDVYPTTLDGTPSGPPITILPIPLCYVTTTNNPFLTVLPKDPQCNSVNYEVISFSATDYKLGAYLETGGTNCGGTCGPGGAQCNYCIGPYGKTN